MKLIFDDGREIPMDVFLNDLNSPEMRAEITKELDAQLIRTMKAVKSKDVTLYCKNEEDAFHECVEPNGSFEKEKLRHLVLEKRTEFYKIMSKVD